MSLAVGDTVAVLPINSFEVHGAPPMFGRVATLPNGAGTQVNWETGQVSVLAAPEPLDVIGSVTTQQLFQWLGQTVEPAQTSALGTLLPSNAASHMRGTVVGVYQRFIVVPNEDNVARADISLIVRVPSRRPPPPDGLAGADLYYEAFAGDVRFVALG